MTDKASYSSPEIVELGDAAELTEGSGSPNVEGQAGSGVYYNANPSSSVDD
jgi:hypothetical protein